MESNNEHIIKELLSLLDGRGSYKEDVHYKFIEILIKKKINKLRNLHNASCVIKNNISD